VLALFVIFSIYSIYYIPLSVGLTGEKLSLYDRNIWEELVRLREAIALQTTLMGFNTMRAQELPESDEAWILEIITKAELLAFPEKLEFEK